MPLHWAAYAAAILLAARPLDGRDDLCAQHRIIAPANSSRGAYRDALDATARTLRCDWSSAVQKSNTGRP